MPDRGLQRPPDYLRQDRDGDQDEICRAELLLDAHRVSGVVGQSGPPRRLVDVLNALDGPVLLVRDAIVHSLADPGEGPYRHGVLHIRREAILLAIPASDSAPSPSGRDAVETRRAAVSLVLSTLRVTGHVYLPPQAEPGSARLLGRRDFLPITEAEVTQYSFGINRWRQPLVIVNLERVLLYAPDRAS